jgi:hypothetical protein
LHLPKAVAYLIANNNQQQCFFPSAIFDSQLRKYRIGEFGVCPLNECNGQPVLPIGLRDTLRYHEVMIYCPRCGLIFHPAQKQLNFRDDNLDGAYFGTTFAHLLLMQVSTVSVECFCWLPSMHWRHCFFSPLELFFHVHTQYPALKPKKKLRLQPYVPRVFGYKIRSQTEDKEKNKKDGRSSGSKEEAKHNPPSPSISQGPGPTITVLEENIQLKHEITALKKMLEDGGSSKVAYPVPAKQ